MDDESNWIRPVAVGLAVLLIVGGVIGGIVALIGVAAVDMTGVGEPRESSTEAPALSEDLPASEQTEDPTGPAATTSTTPTDTTPTTKERDKPRTPIKLEVSSTTPDPGEEIDFTGTYRREGASLQIQRKEGGVWTDFPADPATVSDGEFSTYIYTERTGTQPFRMFDVEREVSSNVVRITIG